MGIGIKFKIFRWGQAPNIGSGSSALSLGKSMVRWGNKYFVGRKRSKGLDK